jgi:uncharacterized cysteine cluster protein YcgN (CxxCxxCC family)
MTEENLCMKCPVRGACCYLSIDLEGFNVILSEKPCEHLDAKTGLCTTYEDRLKVPWCKEGEAIHGCGGLPKGCLLAKEGENLKVPATSIAHKLTPEGLMKYNLMNNIPNIWEIYAKECL